MTYYFNRFLKDSYEKIYKSNLNLYRLFMGNMIVAMTAPYNIFINKWL